MNIAEIVKNYGSGKGEDAMWNATALISDFLKDKLSADDYNHLCKCLYAQVAGRHYNKEFADEQIAKMYYLDKNGEKQYAPYWTEGEVRELYDQNKSNIPDAYNFYDFEVTLNMIKSDYYGLLEEWFGSENTDKRYVELALNWLWDDDNPFGDEKIWLYFNSRP